MPHRYPLTHELKRFAVEFLCLLLVLQGFPAQALQTAQPATVEKTSEKPKTQDDGGVLEAFEDWAEQATHITRQALDQPWTSALGLMLGLSAYAVPQNEAPAELVEEAQTATTNDTTDAPPAAQATPPEAPPDPSLGAPTTATPIRVATRPHPANRFALGKVDKKARQVDASTLPPTGPVRLPAPQPTKRRNKSIAPEITALAESLNGSPAAILRHVHDTIHYDPGYGADSPPLGTLWEGRGTAWDQAWLLQELLLAAGVDARLEWGEVEITPELLTTLAGVDDPIRAADLLTTAGVPIVLVIGGSQVIAARMPHVWVKAHLDFIPDRGIKHGTPDQWIRMDPTLKDHPVIEGQRTDDKVFFVLADHLQSGMEKSPQQDYEDDLLAHAASHGGTSDLDALKPLRTLKAERFPFVPGTLRAKILSIDGLAETVPTTMQVSLEVQARESGAGQLFTWTTPLPAVYGKALELRWRGATSADQANLDLYGGIYTTPPYEIELAAELALDGAVVKRGGALGAAEDVELTAMITPPGGVSATARWDLFAGEHAVLGFDRGRAPQEVIDRHSQRAAAATEAESQETYRLAAAGATYLHRLGQDLDHLGALRWHRVVPLGTAVLAVQRGAVSTFPNGSPETFSRGPLSLDLGAMPLGLFPADGVPVGTVRTLELLGSQASIREGDALAAVFSGEHPTAVGFLKQAVREGQTLTRVDMANLATTLADIELGEDAEASVRDAIAQGKIAWVAETQLEINGWQTSGYVLQEPGTGLGGYYVAFERRISALDGAITFHTPQDLDVLTAPTDVVASIEAEGLQSWTLSTRPAGSSKGTVIATGTGPVDNTLLGPFDPTLLLNGLHELILTGTDVLGQTVSGKIAVSVEGQMKIGHFTLSFIDLAIPVSGLDIEVIRTYDSRQRLEQGDFGQGWTLDIRQGSYRNNRPPGDGWQIPGTEGPWGLPCSTIHETKSHLTTVRLSDQEIYRFRLALRNPATVIGGCYADAVFEWVDGPLPGTTLEVLGTTQVFVATGSSRAVLLDTQEPFIPEDVKLTTRDGRIFHLDLTEGVTHLEDLNGNFLEINPEGIMHSSGKGIDFERDAEGRIVTITDPMGNANRYEYDALGDLMSFTDRVDAPTRFTYTGDHYLEDVENALGVRAVRTEYDAEGRVVRMIDAAGKVVALDHDLDARSETITNRLGFVRLLEYDERGNVIRETDELGNVTLRMFDDDNRLLSETDPLGRTSRYEYTAQGDLSKITHAVGQATTYTLDSLGLPTSIVEPLGITTSAAFDGRGRLISTEDALGHRWAFAYDARGELDRATDPLGHVTSFEVDSFGQRTAIIDALGQGTSFSYDANGLQISETRSRTLADGSSELVTSQTSYDALGRPIRRIAPNGSAETLEYDLLGHLIHLTDPLGRTTHLDYDGGGRLVAITYPDGLSESRGYDAENRLTQVTDRAGRTTAYAYDPAGRLVQTTHPDGAVESLRYDAAGQIISQSDALGHTTRFEYDPAGRLAQQVDPMGGTTSLRYDAAGRLAETEDPKGHVTHFESDLLGRQRFVRLADGYSIETRYDALGRRIAKVDQAGRVTHFGYDALGHLSTVTDALGAITSYGYDELGNLVRLTDVLSNTTHFEVDSRGHRTARILSDGTRETFTYRADGALASHTDFNGGTRTWSYDDLGLPTTRTDSDGATVTFSYTATGQRASVTDSRGAIQYGYDERDRLTEVIGPSGHRLSHVYDAAGRRAESRLTVGATTHSFHTEYDPLGQIAAVVDPLGGRYTFGRDANGNATAITYPNGLSTSQSYDALDRLIESTTVDATGGVVQGYTYTLSPTGYRLAVAEHDGYTQNTELDGLHRLTGEQLTDFAGDQVYAAAYTYDEAGNRISQTLDLPGQSATQLEAIHDARHRLISLGDESFGWDAAGNLVEAGEISYSWNRDGRLIEAGTADGQTVRAGYDADGYRVSTSEPLADGGSRESTYWVDASGRLEHIVAQWQDGELDSLYTRAGDMLLASHDPRTGSTSTYLLDGLGSVRGLADADGQVEERYRYTAFGEPLGPDTPGSTFGFAGEPRVAMLGASDHRARWYLPRLGRFASVDPFEGNRFDPTSLHPYAYAHNSPLTITDPTGRAGDFSLTSLGLAFAISGLIDVAINFNQIHTIGDAALTFVEGGVVGVVFSLVFMGVLRIAGKFFSWASKARKARILAKLATKAGPGTTRFGGQIPQPLCAECSKAIAQALGLSDELLAGTLDDAIANGSDGIINVLKGTGSETNHFAVKIGDEIIDRTIKENLRSYSGSVLPKGAETILGDTWTIAQYMELRKIFVLVLTP